MSHYLGKDRESANGGGLGSKYLVSDRKRRCKRRRIELGREVELSCVELG